jgi:hypothetical protein
MGYKDDCVVSNVLSISITWHDCDVLIAILIDFFFATSSFPLASLLHVMAQKVDPNNAQNLLEVGLSPL